MGQSVPGSHHRNMLLLLSLVSSALAAPQFYPYAYPSAYYQYPVHYPMVHPVYGYPHQAIYPSATAGAPMQRIGVATSSLLAAVSGTLGTTTLTTATVEGTVRFEQNAITDLLQSNDAKMLIYLKGNPTTALANACGTAMTAAETITEIQSPLVILNGFWVTGRATGFNLDGTNSKSALRGMVIQVESGGSIIGCTNAALA